ncbi:MAG: hypothetical protein E6K03_01110 [Methanobacteriota archaeon]|nr:MAG: hypothetical protein E6K03_01110 [Euryarchaeota archaeon]
MPRLRDRPVPFRRKVPRRVLLRVRRHAGRPDARRGPQVDGRRAARDDRRRADRGLRRDDRRRHGAVDGQVRAERRKRDGEDRGKVARGASPRRDRREPTRRVAEGPPRPRRRNQRLRRPERGRRGEDEHPGVETKGVRREARDRRQGPPGPEGPVWGGANDGGPHRRGPHEVHEGELSGLRSKLEAMATQTTFLEERRTEVGSRLTALDGQRKDHEKRIDSFQESLGRLETEIRGLEKTDREADLDKVTHKIDTKEDFLLKMQTELTVQEEQLAEAERVMKEMAVELQEGRLPSLEELKTTIADCEAAINALGPINLRALEDYDAQQARAVELKDEFKRLEGQREELIHLVDELTDKKKEGLAKIFTSINENFSRVYAELTEGGEAELALENPEKPFEAGLLLKVKPAHKKALRLEALSGGERSLASMALIFAIQEYDPSPFYLLDEIDQNLDAVNAEKVARMIRRNSATAQFVQISLRKVSLKEADHLVGVTMTPESLSEVIMRVNLADVEDEKPTEAIPA